MGIVDITVFLRESEKPAIDAQDSSRGDSTKRAGRNKLSDLAGGSH